MALELGTTTPRDANWGTLLSFWRLWMRLAGHGSRAAHRIFFLCAVSKDRLGDRPGSARGPE